MSQTKGVQITSLQSVWLKHALVTTTHDPVTSRVFIAPFFVTSLILSIHIDAGLSQGIKNCYTKTYQRLKKMVFRLLF